MKYVTDIALMRKFADFYTHRVNYASKVFHAISSETCLRFKAIARFWGYFHIQILYCEIKKLHEHRSEIRKRFWYLSDVTNTKNLPK